MKTYSIIGLILSAFMATVTLASQAFAEPSGFAEYPESRESIVSELKTRNTEIRKCSERKRCVFLMVYSEFLLNRLKTIDEGADPLAHLERRYGQDAYRFVKEDEDLIELKFDEYFTEGILRRTGGKMPSEENGFRKEEVRNTYESYVIEEALPELLERIRKAKSQKIKALYAYGIQYLLSDMRLLVPSE